MSPELLPAPARSLKIEKEPPTSITPGDDARRWRLWTAGRRERTGLRAQVALERSKRYKSSTGRLRIQDVLAVELRRADGALAVLGRFYGFCGVVLFYFFLRGGVVLALAEVAEVEITDGFVCCASCRRDEGGCAR